MTAECKKLELIMKKCILIFSADMMTLNCYALNDMKKVLYLVQNIILNNVNACDEKNHK